MICTRVGQDPLASISTRLHGSKTGSLPYRARVVGGYLDALGRKKYGEVWEIWILPKQVVDVKIGWPGVSWRDLHSWLRFSWASGGTYRHVTLEGPTQARKLEIWEIGTGKAGPHVGVVGPKSMLNSRYVGDHLRGRRRISFLFLGFVNLDPGLA